MESQNYCGNCGTAFFVGNKYCTACGSPKSTLSESENFQYLEAAAKVKKDPKSRRELDRRVIFVVLGITFVMIVIFVAKYSLNSKANDDWMADTSQSKFFYIYAENDHSYAFVDYAQSGNCTEGLQGHICIMGAIWAKKECPNLTSELTLFYGDGTVYKKVQSRGVAFEPALMQNNTTFDLGLYSDEYSNFYEHWGKDSNRSEVFRIISCKA